MTRNVFGGLIGQFDISADVVSDCVAGLVGI